MKLSLFQAFAIVLVLCGGATAQTKHASLANLKFMSGCWEMSRPERKQVVTEQWMMPLGDAMIGMSRTVVDGKMTEFEFLRLQQKGSEINYIALPSGNDEPTAFKLVELSKTEVTFENREHDFPQRVIYSLKKDGSLLAAVEGEIRDRPTRREFPMKRVKCR